MGLAFVFVKQQQALHSVEIVISYAPQNLREINFCAMKTQKTVILTISKSLNVDFCDSK